ncbi:MAG: sulfatase [Planctomycetota bacterium]
MKTGVLMISIALLILGPRESRSEAGAEQTRPNILFIFLDDFGWKDASFMGSDFYETPNIDRLAAGGMIFDNAYSCAANCAPARACLLSGQYTPRHQIFNVGTTPRGKAAFRKLEHVAGKDILDPNIRTWAHQVQNAGYATASIGKWHLSDDPLPYGFDLNIGGTHSGSPPRGYYPPHNQTPGLSDAPEDEYLTDRLSVEACEFIAENENRPWMLYLTHFAVHTPLNPKKQLVEKYRNKKPGKLHNHVAMATMIQSVDDGVGMILQKLDELELRENTVILFYSDNGGYGPATDMDPLKGYKGTYYEGGIRVPFFVNWPCKVSPGELNHEPVIGVDLYPTICEIAGADMPSDQVADGISLVPLFQNQVDHLDQNGSQRSLYWHFPAYLQAYSATSEQRDPLFRSRPCSAIRRGKWKLIEYFETGEIELFNLKKELSEDSNQADQHPDVAEELLNDLRNWQARTSAAIPKALNPAYDPAKEQSAIAKALAKQKKKKENKNRQRLPVP